MTKLEMCSCRFYLYFIHRQERKKLLYSGVIQSKGWFDDHLLQFRWISQKYIVVDDKLRRQRLVRVRSDFAWWEIFSCDERQYNNLIVLFWWGQSDSYHHANETTFRVKFLYGMAIILQNCSMREMCCHPYKLWVKKCYMVSHGIFGIQIYNAFIHL
jgi:hypothetical protein